MMQAAPELSLPDSSIQRASVYRLLSSCFLEAPTPKRIALFCDSGQPAAPDDDGVVHQEFMDLLKVPLGRYVPPYEAVHRDCRLIDGVATRGLLMGPCTVDVRRLYHDAGANLQIPELPDHIGVELAFLAFLCEREQVARSEGDPAAAENYRAYQRGFLADHVLRWVPDYCEIVRQHSTTSYFRALSELTPEFCQLDFARLDAS